MWKKRLVEEDEEAMGSGKRRKATAFQDEDDDVTPNPRKPTPFFIFWPREGERG